MIRLVKSVDCIIFKILQISQCKVHVTHFLTILSYDRGQLLSKHFKRGWKSKNEFLYFNMGCLFSKEKGTCTCISLSWNTSNKDLNKVRKIPKKDARLPLNAREAFKLKQSWRGLDRQMELAGVEMFVR